MSIRDRVAREFTAHFAAEPALVVRAPGRVNIIGEHTDYNDGFVLPMAIERAVYIACRPTGDDEVKVHSLDFDETGQFTFASIRELAPGVEGWLEYIKGTSWAMQDAGHSLTGWEGVVAGDVPVGAGLSSSAALEMATARVFTELAGIEWDAAAMALLGQRAENKWVGVNCGIMDQMISAAGRAGHALLLDCRSLESELVPLPESIAMVVLDTGTRRGLVDSAYNERRAQCEVAARFFGVEALRDVDEHAFAKKMRGLDEVVRRRALHVIAENARTVRAVAAMRAGDSPTLGRLMDESHASLRDDFEVSSAALDGMVEVARAQPGCYGARMTGAGFGGCVVALVEEERAADFAAAVVPAYARQTGNEPSAYICQATHGSGRV